jgi:hypothetical protein
MDYKSALNYLKNLNKNKCFNINYVYGYDSCRNKMKIYEKELSKAEHILNKFIKLSNANVLRNKYENNILALKVKYINLKFENESIANKNLEKLYLKCVNNINNIIQSYFLDKNNYKINNYMCNYFYTVFFSNLNKKINVEYNLFLKFIVMKFYIFVSKYDDNTKYIYYDYQKNKYIKSTKSYETYDRNICLKYLKLIKKYKLNTFLKIIYTIEYQYKKIIYSYNAIHNKYFINYIPNYIYSLNISSLEYGNYELFINNNFIPFMNLLINNYSNINILNTKDIYKVSTIDYYNKHIIYNLYRNLYNIYYSAIKILNNTNIIY